jgi:fructuronate reductase
MIAALAYDRSALVTTVVHLGLGAFSRAHILTYLDDLALAGVREVGVLGASMTSERVPEALAPQAGLYTVVEASASGRRSRTIGVLTGLAGPARRAEVIAALAAPTTALVTTTVTEKAYGFDPATGGLDPTHPAIAHDLADPITPVGVVGILVAGLVARRRAGAGPLTIACCDNVAGNGRMLASLVGAMAQRLDPDTARWIETEVAFPDSMVDRIVPATTDALRAEVAAEGIHDAWPVITEPFRQWVLEDRCTAGVPPLQEVGVTCTPDVAAWERMKLRVLNGMHSACAYLGLRLGHPTIADVVADPRAAGLLDALEAEILAVLEPPAEVDPWAYAATVRARFANPAVGHQCRQIAMDGSAKLPQRILPTVAAALDAQTSVDALARVIAWWVGHLRRTPVGELEDPRAGELGALVRRHRCGTDVAGALMALEGFAPPRLAHDARWRATLAEAIDRDGAP